MDVDDRVYLKITVDPLLPSSIIANFFGPTKAIDYYRNLYRERIHEWNTSDDIYRNLLRIFGKYFLVCYNLYYFIFDMVNVVRYQYIFFCFHAADKISFPLKNEDQSNEKCSICYTYRLCDQIPIISCDNEKCHLIYHSICLREWFLAIRESKTFLNVTSGRCPFCKEVCSLSMTDGNTIILSYP